MQDLFYCHGRVRKWRELRLWIGHSRGMKELTPDICYRALQARDPRFDGRLFVGVTSTGIYCRPICPARTPKRENCRFFPTSAAAQEAGFRACLRCRPEISPELACWRGTSNTVSRALVLIAEGFLDREDATVEALATRVGMGGRQLRRLFEQHLGASPIAVAQTRRVLFAKQLIHDRAGFRYRSGSGRSVHTDRKSIKVLKRVRPGERAERPCELDDAVSFCAADGIP